MSDVVAERIVALAAALRAAGVRVGTAEVTRAVAALAVVDVLSREQCRLALRTVLCARRDDLVVFEECFEAVFGSGTAWSGENPLEQLGAAQLALPRVAAPEESRTEAPEEDGEPVPAAYSDVELLRDADFAQYTPAERRAARAVLRRLARRGPTRLGRRTRAVRRGGHRPDLPATLRAALRTGGEPLLRPGRERVASPRPLVLIVDVSGSMAPYARMLLMYAQAAVAARPRVEVFALGTRLTRITRELRAGYGPARPDAALARALAAVEDYSGGTRIGAALGALNREHGRRLGRGATVVLLSDGWDRGEPELLAAEMARLRRSAHRVIWLNPLKAREGYAPLARGMAAALPHTDHFLPGHSLGSLYELAAILEQGTSS